MLLVRLFLILIVIGVGSDTNASPCLVLPADSQRHTLVQARELPFHFDECKGLKVENGPAVACYHNKLGQKQCTTFKTGEHINIPEAPQPGEMSLWEVLAKLLSGDETVRHGGKRLKDSQQLAGFPYGEIMMPRWELAFRVTAAGSDGVGSFLVYDQREVGRAIFRVGRVRDVIHIPAQVLRHGGSYEWIAGAAFGQVRGTFRILGRSDQSELEQELERVRRNSSGSEIARRLLEATVYDESGYVFDRDATLDEVRAIIAGARHR